MLKFVTGTLESWSAGDVRLKTDQEQGILALAKAARGARPELRAVLANSPAYSHESQGPAERMNQSVAGQARAFQLSLQAHLGRRLPSDHPLMPRIVRHAGWTLSKFTTRPCGRTPMGLTYGRAFRGELVELGVRVFGRSGGQNEEQKLDGRWVAGIWLG